MSSVEYLRELVNKRLTAAAEEIFTVFEQIIVEHEEQIDRQRRLFDIVCKPEIKLHRIELPQQHVCEEEEVPVDQQLCIQETTSSLDQEDPEPPQIKEKEEGQQLVLKQETETFMLTPTHEESDHSEDQTLDLNAAEKETVVNIPVISSVLSLSNSDQQLLPHISHEAESQNQKRDSESTRNTEPTSQNRHLESRSHRNNVNNSNLLKIHGDPRTKKQTFKCDTCGKGFKYKSHLERHMRLHTGERPYSCKTCGKCFKRNNELKVHMRLHTGEKPYSCKTCGKCFGRNDELKVHVRIHTELPQQHVCEEEEVPVDQQLCIQERTSSLDQEDPEPPQIKEEEEGQQLVLKQETETFMSTPTHEESDHSENQSLDLNAAEKETVVNMPVITSVLSLSNSDQQLLPHISHEAESQNQKRDSESTRNTEPTSQNRHQESRSLSNNVNNSNLLKIHGDTQTESHKCNTCGKVFTYKSHLERHMRLHTVERPYSCKTCGKRFKRNNELKVHMRLHTGEKPFSCKTCGKCFGRNDELTVHMRIHTGEKPYSCETCGKRFIQISALNSHMRSHTGEKPYSCETCGKRFSQLSSLNSHKRSHTGDKPYFCKTCGNKFSQLSTLNSHERIHTGEKPYSCKKCGKDFRHSGELKGHMRVHTGERPISC